MCLRDDSLCRLLRLILHDKTAASISNMSRQGYVAAPPYSQAQPRLGGYPGALGAGAAQPLNGHYGGPPQAFAAPPAGRKLPDLRAGSGEGGSFPTLKPDICRFLRRKIPFFLIYFHFSI